MKSSNATHAATAAILVVLAVAAWQRSPRSAENAAESDSRPEDAIYAMFDAERQGDVGKYLDSYTGALQASLRQTATEMTAEGFGRSLRERNAPVRGVAISKPDLITETEMKAKVEYVYADRNETQNFYLEKARGAWKIARVDGADHLPTVIPYGTAVR